MPLTRRYRPKKFSEIRGQDIAIERIKLFMKNFPKKKALILNGPPGTGKTCLAYCLASESNSEIIEINASDLRNREQINKIIGEATKQNSLFNQAGKILLVDEIDGVNKNDYGGLGELIKIIQDTNFPIILTSNNIWDRKFSNLRRKAELLDLKELNYEIILQILRNITEKENLEISDNLLKSIAIKCKGDVRAAINDLQTLHPESTQEEIHERDKQEDIFKIMKKIFQQLPDKETTFLYDKSDMNLDEILLWIEENAPLEYKEKELYNAFEAISKADVFRGRIYRQQHWRFLVYQNFFLSAGISASKKQVKLGFTRYKKPSRILKIWLINQKQKYKKSIAIKYAKHTHVNIKRAMREFPILKNILKSPEIQKELKLDNQEIEFLTTST